MRRISNWSRSVRFTPVAVVAPRTEAEVVDALLSARGQGRTVRVIGAGHSFTPLVATDGVLLNLDELSGVTHVEGHDVTLRAGTRLRDIGTLLAPWGLALPNMGDIDSQSVAGAVSTGTHGTGLDFTGYSGMVTALRLALPDGRVVDCSKEQECELFDAARVGLGAFGVILTVTLRCVPAFVLEAGETTEPIAGLFESFLPRSREADHLEFFWFPGTGRATVKELRRLPAGHRTRPAPPFRRVVSDLLSNGAFGALNAASAVAPGLAGPTREVASRLMAGPRFSDQSHRVFVSPRRVRFRETEYALPLDTFPGVVSDVERAIMASGVSVAFPIEVRTAAADDTWLGTASGRESLYVAVHRYFRQDLTPFLAAVEPIFRHYGGRPHWGKEHTLSADDVTRLYPRAADARRIREKVDPDGVLLNAHLRALLVA